MKPGAKVVCLLAGSLAVAAFAQGATLETPLERHVAVMDNPYNPIVERNVFDLHDPPPPPAPTPTNAPPPNVHLTGITTILGKKQAYFMLQASPGANKASQGDRYMTLSEGQRQDMLEVLEIDPKTKMVKISNSGNISTITFETNKIAFSPPMGGAAGNAAARGGVGGLAPGQMGNPAPNYYPNSPAAVPPRPMRPSGTTDANPYGGGNYGNQAYNGYNNNNGYNSSAYNQAYANNTGARAAQPTAVPQVDPDQQIVLMELQREATKSAVANGQLPPLPPTPLSQIMQQEQQQNAQQGGGAPAPNLPNFPGVHNSTGK